MAHKAHTHVAHIYIYIHIYIHTYTHTHNNKVYTSTMPRRLHKGTTPRHKHNTHAGKVAAVIIYMYTHIHGAEVKGMLLQGKCGIHAKQGKQGGVRLGNHVHPPRAPGTPVWQCRDHSV